MTSRAWISDNDPSIFSSFGIAPFIAPHASLPDEHKATLQRLYKELDELRPIRNFLVHGETWEGAFKGKPHQPYRVGLVKKNLEYLDEFERADHGPNVFDVQQVRDATRRCAGIHQELAELRDAIAATAVPCEEQVTDAP